MHNGVAPFKKKYNYINLTYSYNQNVITFNAGYLSSHTYVYLFIGITYFFMV